MKIILAIDSFKGCLSSAEVETVVATALEAKGHEVISIPMSDGGEGMLEVFCSAVKGCKKRSISIHDPLMRLISTSYAITPDGTAIIESAAACGLSLMRHSERNPLIASTYGVGELIADAISQSCRNFIIGLGGSGTSDAGRGMLTALAEKFSDSGSIYEISSALKECNFTLASDVRVPLCGPNGAASVFAAQKGANAQMITELDHRAAAFAAEAAAEMGRDASKTDGAGAAGGLGYAFLQFMNAKMRSGAELLLELCDFRKLASDADLIITGEGHADSQTLMGKLPEMVLRCGQELDVPVWLIAGRVSDRDELLKAGFAAADAVTPPSTPDNEAVISETATRNLIKYVENMGF